MKKIIFTIPVAGAVAAVVALGVTSIQPWRWENTANKKEINYCLLIGQTDHNDSAARTRGIREALGTRVDEAQQDENPNVEVAKQGKKKFTVKSGQVEYTINELERKVCISDAGATWDQSTAINTCNTWYAKFQNKITMIVSNNDGMAEGALFSALRPEGMPIFGYDSNESTMKLIKSGKITGTINSNAPAQAAAINILAARILDKAQSSDTAESLAPKVGITYDTSKKTYGYTDENLYKILFKGFDFGTAHASYDGDSEGYVESGKRITDITNTNTVFKFDPKDHSLLVSSNIVDKNNVDKFLKTPKDQSTKIHAAPVSSKKNYKFFQSCYSQTDTYLTSTFNPLVTEFRDMYGINDSSLADMVYGNGNDEDKILNAVETKPAAQAYIINMTKTVNADKYIAKIKAKINDDAKFKKTPIIFYNRQPSTKKNKVDPTYLLPETNGGNPFVFYVGFDANAGADKQGEMIVNWLQSQVTEHDK